VRAQAETVAAVPFCVVDNIRFLYRTAIPARGFFGGRPGAKDTLLISVGRSTIPKATSQHSLPGS
jgi:hypothetical protein